MNRQELPIKNPCTQDWNTMEGDERQRLCRVCDKPVHNLSAMTRQQAQAVLHKRSLGQRLCVRYSAGDDGEIMFERPALIPAGLLVRTRQLALRATLAAAALASVVEAPGCVPAGPVTGALAARVAAEQVADQLAESGTCSISLEPLLPLTLTLHAAACATPPEPIEVFQGEPPALPEPPLPPAQPPPPPPEPPTTISTTSTPRPRSASSRKKAAPKPHILMGDIAD